MHSNKKKYMGVGIALGIAIGAGLGVVFHNIPVLTGFGVVIGVAIGSAMQLRANRESY